METRSLLDRMYDLRSEPGDWTSTQRYNWDAVNEDYSRLKREERTYQAARQVEESRSVALQGWFADHMSGAKPSQRQ